MRIATFALGAVLLLSGCGKEQAAPVDPTIEENIRKYTTALGAYKTEATKSASEARRLSQVADNFLADLRRIDSSITGANQNIAASSNELGLAAGGLEELARTELPSDDADRKKLEERLRTYYSNLAERLDRLGRQLGLASDYMYSASTYLDRSYRSLGDGARQFQNEILVTSDRVRNTAKQY